MSSSRALTTKVWYPAGPIAAHPLVVFAHGFRVGIGPYVRACQAWARRGFVVAAPSFPLTDQTVAGASLDETDMVNQAADVSFVTSQLIALSAPGPSPLSGLIDSGHMAVVGHSDGADTALDIGYLPSRRDLRIQAIVADAPDPLARAAGAPRLVSQVPLLLIHGDRDAIAPFSGSQQVTRQLATPGWFLVLKGADHLSPIEGPSPWTSTFDRVTGDFLSNVFAGTPSASTNLVADVSGSPASLGALG